MISSERAHLFVAALSHKGMKEGKNNEDRYAISSYYMGEDDATSVLFAIVSDGIGGHRAGEVAAEMVVDYVSQAIAESDAQEPTEIIRQAVAEANQAVSNLAEEDPEKQGMGATVVCVLVIGNRLFAGAVGDSRLYLMRGDAIQQLTTDHTWIQEALDKGILTPEQAREHPNAHVIRQYVGSINPPEVDFRLRLRSEQNSEAKKSNQGFRLKTEDTLLLCSDGLTDLVREDEILEIVRSSIDHDAAAESLISTANQRGGHDNITVILLSVPENINKPKKEISLALIIGGVIAILIAISALIGFIWYIGEPSVTPTVLVPPTPPIATTLIPNTPAFAPSKTPTSHPTVGSTYTPWPTNEP